MLDNVGLALAQPVAAFSGGEGSDGAGDIFSRANRIVARMALTLCEGDRANLSRCTPELEALCEQHTAPSCPKRIVAFERQRELDDSATRIRESRLADKIKAALLEAFFETEATRAVDGFLSGRRLFLVLAGATGCGKSVGCGWALVRGTGLYLRASELTDKSNPRRREWLDKAEAARLLLVDDVGREFQDRDGFAAWQLEDLLCTRHEAKRRTLITTNLAAGDFFGKYGPRLADRIAGDGIFKALSGGSLRGVEK